jgi:long-chain fatty acid transport protein
MVFVRGDSYTHAPHPSDVPEPAGLEGTNTDRATLTNISLLPMLGGTYRLGDFAFGVAFYIPFGGGAVWDEDERFAGDPEYPGAAGGSQRWHALDGTLQVFYWTAAVAYEIPETGLSLGATASLIRSEIVSLNARTAMGNNDLNDEGRSLIDVGSWDGGFGVGAMLEAIAEVLWLGASYTSSPGVVGGQRLEGTLKNNFGSIDELDVDFHQHLPDIVRLGARYRPTKSLELRLHGDWTRWSLFENQCVALAGDPCEVDASGAALSTPVPIQNMRRSWNDGFGVRLGVSVWPEPRWEIFTGLGYDSNAIPDETLEPSFLDFDDFAAAAGARVQVIERHLALELAYTQFFNLPRDNAGKSTLATAADSYNRVPDAGGHYTEWAGLVNAGVHVGF